MEPTLYKILPTDTEQRPLSLQISPSMGVCSDSKPVYGTTLVHQSLRYYLLSSQYFYHPLGNLRNTGPLHPTHAWWGLMGSAVSQREERDKEPGAMEMCNINKVLFQ